MKKLYLILFCFISTNIVVSQEEFITTWEVQEDDLTILVPIITNITNDFSIDFGDGTILTEQTGMVNHTYQEAGIYTVIISGIYKQIQFEGIGDANKLKSIEQWGTNQWTSMSGAFFGCENLVINATDAPDLSQTNNMNKMFQGATSLNQSLNHWDVSTIENMQFVFYQAESFNQPLDNWDVSNVSITHNMFAFATSFNQDINSWDTSSLINSSGMFRYAESFNQPIGNWNMSNVGSMSGMFLGATSFNQPLNNWNVQNTENFANVFREAISFNQPINNWNLSSALRTDGMFQDAISFNQPIGNWNIHKVEMINSMFKGATAFNQPLNNWNLTAVKNASSLFEGAITFNQPLNNWSVFTIINISNMFKDATSFNQDISNWTFHIYANLSGFLSYSALNVENYDALLNRFITQNVNSFNVGAHTLEYCDEDAHNYLTSEKNFVFNGDSLSDDCSMNTHYNLNDKISVYPNPTNGIVYIASESTIEIKNINLYNIQGQKIFDFNTTTNLINIEHLSSGMYLMDIKTDKGSLSQKIIKK